MPSQKGPTINETRPTLGKPKENPKIIAPVVVSLIVHTDFIIPVAVMFGN